jgi:plastocyanin
VKSTTDSRKRSRGLAAGSIVAIVVIVAVVAAFVHVNMPGQATSSQVSSQPGGQATNSTTQASNQPPPANSVYVNIGEMAVYPYNSFGPATVTVFIGVNNTVVWQNIDQTHGSGTSIASVVSTTGLFSSGTLQPGAEWWFTFTTPGTYTYNNGLYPSETGVVVVKSS